MFFRVLVLLAFFSSNDFFICARCETRNFYRKKQIKMKFESDVNVKSERNVLTMEIMQKIDK